MLSRDGQEKINKIYELFRQRLIGEDNPLGYSESDIEEAFFDSLLMSMLFFRGFLKGVGQLPKDKIPSDEECCPPLCR